MSEPGCVCGGTGLLTTLTENGGNTGPMICPRCYVAVEKVEVLLREVSRDFAGAHVNAGVVVGAVRRRLAGPLRTEKP